MSSKIKQLKNLELEEAVQFYLTERSLEAKEAVIYAGESLINYYAGLYSSGKPDEDLKQAGYEGILKALKRYDPDTGNMFSTFAVHCIIGEIRHELRRREYFKIPDWLKKLQSAVINATEELAQLNGCMPTLSDIAKRVNVAEEGIAEAMQAGYVSLDEVDLGKVKHLRYESFKLPIEDKITVQMSLERMDNISKKVITLIFYEGCTQEQTAKKLGISQRQVSRIMNRGLKDMSAYILA
jgi:RNA polymerase sigma-B factor